MSWDERFALRYDEWSAEMTADVAHYTRLALEAAAATLLYRALTVFPTLALGLLAAATWRTHQPGDTIGSPSDP